MTRFLRDLREQRWDDHRYYHHSRVNQSLHLLSAVTFVVAYGVAFKDPAAAALLGWLISMTSRQIGHLVFEPKGYDSVNQATHDYKEEIKVGYNLKRKIVLMAVWALSPLLFVFDPTPLGLCAAPPSTMAFAHHVGTLWLLIAVCGLLFRMTQLLVVRDLQTALVWATKIVTDPFHDIKLYYRAPVSWLGRRKASTDGFEPCHQHLTEHLASQ